MADDPALNLHVVRNMGSDKTHVMHVVRTTTERVFGVAYQRPTGGQAACGVRIGDGVLMRHGTKVRCGACRHLTNITTETSA